MAQITGDEMEINEIRRLRGKLEADIYMAVTPLLASFSAATGEGAKAVNIDILSVHHMADAKPTYVVGKVSVTVDL